MRRQFGLVMLIAIFVAICSLGALTVATASTQAAPWPGKIAGTITNGETGKPISGVTVELLDASGKRVAGPVTSDSKGAYSIDAPQPGNYVVSAKHEDYEPLTAGVAVGLDPLPPFDMRLNEYHVIDIPPDHPGTGEAGEPTALGGLLSTLLPGLAIGLLLVIGASKSRDLRHHN